MKHAQLANGLLQLGCIQFGEFTLKSGKRSPIYLDLRRLVSDPAVLAQAAQAYVQLLKPLDFDRIAGLPYAALPIATAISLQGGWPMIYPRKEKKDYGTKSAVEGLYQAGETIAVVDDLISTGESKFEGIEKLEAAGLNVHDVVVLVDRQMGADDVLAANGLKLHAIFKLRDLLDYWNDTQAISGDDYQSATDYLMQD